MLTPAPCSLLPPSPLPAPTGTLNPGQIPEGELLTFLRESARHADAHPRPTLSSKRDDARTRRSHAAHRARLERRLAEANA